jgi:hypothetical protein
VCYEAAPELDAGWVAVGDSCFAPRGAEVATGDAVRWEKTGQIDHTVTFRDGPDSGSLTQAGFAVQFNQPGVYEYFCSYHPGMTGTVGVQGDAVTGPALEIIGPDDTTTSGARTSVLQDSVPMRLEFSPLTAVVVLAVGLPLSLGLAMRLVGFARSPAGYRLRVPWEPSRPPQRPSARR